MGQEEGRDRRDILTRGIVAAQAISVCRQDDPQPKVSASADDGEAIPIIDVIKTSQN